jgi:hypothetical protein
MATPANILNAIKQGKLLLGSEVERSSKLTHDIKQAMVYLLPLTHGAFFIGLIKPHNGTLRLSTMANVQVWAPTANDVHYKGDTFSTKLRGMMGSNLQCFAIQTTTDIALNIVGICRGVGNGTVDPKVRAVDRFEALKLIKAAFAGLPQAKIFPEDKPEAFDPFNL